MQRKAAAPVGKLQIGPCQSFLHLLPSKAKKAWTVADLDLWTAGSLPGRAAERAASKDLLDLQER